MDLIFLHLLATSQLIDPSHSREYLLCLIHIEKKSFKDTKDHVVKKKIISIRLIGPPLKR